MPRGRVVYFDFGESSESGIFKGSDRENLRESGKGVEGWLHLEARQNLLEGAFLAGVCLTSSSTVAVHALSYPLGGKYHIPHGVSNAILLEAVMRVNLPDCQEAFTELAPLMLSDCGNILKEKWPEAVVDYMGGLCRRLQIPDSLRTFGIESDALEELTDNALEVKRLLLKNPRKLTREEIRGIYEGLLQ